MKSTFKFTFANVNISIEDTPISIGNLDLDMECEANVQEMMQSMSSFKTLIREIKDVVKPDPVVIESTTSPVPEPNKIIQSYTNPHANTPEPKKHEDAITRAEFAAAMEPIYAMLKKMTENDQASQQLRSDNDKTVEDILKDTEPKKQEDSKPNKDNTATRLYF